MYRYRPDTVSVVLNNYLCQYRSKLTNYKRQLEAVQVSTSASQSDKTQAIKELARVSNVLAEIDDYERDVIFPLAT